MWVGVGFAEEGCAAIPLRETEAGSGTGWPWGSLEGEGGGKGWREKVEEART